MLFASLVHSFEGTRTSRTYPLSSRYLYQTLIHSSQVRDAPPGAQFATLDIEAAYRGIPCLPAHKRYLIVYHDGKLYIDHNIPFGLASAAGLQGEVADATVAIWRELNVKPSKKWVDDVSIFRFPSPTGLFVGFSNGSLYHYEYDLNHAKLLISPAKVPWHPDKGQNFRDNGDYVGFFWDLPQKSVSLTELKRLKYIMRLSEFLLLFENSKVQKRELESVAGFLNHASFVYLHGRSYLSSLYSAISAYHSNDYIPRWLPKSTISDIKWWHRLLLADQSPRSLAPHPPTRDYGIWVDASTDTGIGLLWNTRWAFWRTNETWRGPSRDIGWLEAIAVELAIRLIHSKHITDADVLIRSDNQGVIASFKKGRCSNHLINMAIRRSEELLREAHVSLTFIYVESALNLADPISRGILPPRFSHLSSPPSLPPEISSYFRDEGN